MMNVDCQVDKLEYDELDNKPVNGGSLFSQNIDLIKNVKVKLEVRLGRCELSIDELFNLKETGVIKLDTEVDMPVEVLLDNNIIAKGMLVAVDDNFGVSITEIQHT